MPRARVLLDDVSTGNVRWHQVGRELDASKLHAERLRQRTHHQRFGGARHAGQQHMAAHEERDQHLVDHLVLPHDDLAHLPHNALAHRVKSLNMLL